MPRLLLELHAALEHAVPVQVDSSHGHRGWQGSETVLRHCLEHGEMRTKGKTLNTQRTAKDE